jgi:hypothetical protein
MNQTEAPEKTLVYVLDTYDGFQNIFFRQIEKQGGTYSGRFCNIAPSVETESTRYELISEWKRCCGLNLSSKILVTSRCQLTYAEVEMLRSIYPNLVESKTPEQSTERKPGSGKHGLLPGEAEALAKYKLPREILVIERPGNQPGLNKETIEAMRQAVREQVGNPAACVIILQDGATLRRI